MMEKNGPTDAYTDVMMRKAHLDWEMESLQSKIKCKNEENSKLENQMSERKNEYEKLKKSVSTSCEREEHVKNNINMLRNSRTISEGLLMSMKHQLRILEEKRNDTKTVRKNIIEKYSKIFESHIKIYSNLPWVKKINELKMSVQSRQIHLDILKLEYLSLKRKISLFHRIQDQRKVVAITQLAKSLVARNNLQKEVEGLTSKQKEFQSRIIMLEEEKINLQKRIDLKIKKALDEARGRVVNKHVVESTVGKQTIVTATADVVAPFGTNSKPRNESIFSRLGLSVPSSMKRLLVPSSRILSRANDIMEEESTKMNVTVAEKLSTVQENSVTSQVQNDKQTMEEEVKHLEHPHGLKEHHAKKDDAKKKHVLVKEKIVNEEKSLKTEVKRSKPMVEGKSLSASQTLKRPSTCSSNISEKIPYMMESIRKNKVLNVENACSENVLSSEDKGSKPNNEKSGVMQQLITTEPTVANNPMLIQIQTEEEMEIEGNTGQTAKKSLKNIVIKKSNSESTSAQLSENKKNYIAEKNSNQNAVVLDESSKDNENEFTSNPLEEQVTLVNAPQKIPTEKEIQSQKPVLEHHDSPREVEQEKTIMNEVEMNDSNLSVLDNISVVSSTFTYENRNQMAKSPDFLNQIPQGYCFSPLYSPSKADSISEISSVKGAKSPSNNFPTTSISSPLFHIDRQPTAGPSSDFSSFFGTFSPKKNENSSKNFFQLFG